MDLPVARGILVAGRPTAGKGLALNDRGQIPLSALRTFATAPATSSAPTLALGTAYQNTLGYNILLVVYLSVTVNTSGVVKLGVGPTATPTQQTIITGVTTIGFATIPIYLPAAYYALLSISGVITDSITGQIAMPI